MPKDPKKRAKQLEDKGDRLFKKGKYAKALEAYEEAQTLDKDNPDIYNKLIDAHSKGTEAWDLEEFTRELDWTLQQEELENPRISRLHEQLSPEFKTITELIYRLAAAPDKESEEEFIDAIMQAGDKALVPLIEFIRALKESQEA